MAERGGAHTLNRPSANEHRNPRREAARHGGEREQTESPHEDAFCADSVAQPPGREDKCRKDDLCKRSPRVAAN